VPPAAGLNEARAFAESVAGVLDGRPPAASGWTPGTMPAPPPRELGERLGDLGWDMLAGDPELVVVAGVGAVELGRRLAPVALVDRLLGAGPAVRDLVRSLGNGDGRMALATEHGTVVRRSVLRSEAVASADGLEVHRVLEWGDVHAGAAPAALDAWTAAGIGYLAGLGEAAVELTVAYVRQRRAFGSTLGALAPVQQLLAGAATAVRGVRLLAAEPPDADALAHAGHAVAEACAAAQQATGAIGFTLEYPLHRYTQRARALAAWHDALLDGLVTLRRAPAAGAGLA
jgi:Acyl-CoA dehydrogenase, C-terminal domain